MREYLRAAMPLALALTLLSCSADESVQNVAAAKDNSALLVQNYNYTSDEMQLADAINNHRQGIGLAPLEVVNFISIKSEEHTEYMIANHVVNHDNFEQRAKDIIDAVGAQIVDENIAYNYSTANAVLHAWLDSPNHKANIEGNFTHFGFSIRIDPETGKKYYTNIFIKK
jgi:uncharacterized protein YkwD